jgi:hypothetical protein
MKLPSELFEISEWSEAKVHKDHHIVFKGNFYSVPNQYIGNQVIVRSTLRMIELYFDNQMIKSHIKAEGKGKWISDINDYCESALYFLNKNPEKCIEEAQSIGTSTEAVIKIILAKPGKQRLRKAQAILRLKENYSSERLEKACTKSINFNNYEYSVIKNMLDKKIEDVDVNTDLEGQLLNYVNSG